MKLYQKILLVILTVLLFFVFAIPLIKGALIGLSVLVLAASLAFAFVLGALVVAAATSPLWIPFLMSWAAVQFCKKHLEQKEKPITRIEK